MSNGAYLGPNRVILDELYVCLGRPKGLEFGKDTWREAPTLQTSLHLKWAELVVEKNEYLLLLLFRNTNLSPALYLSHILR